MAQGQESTQKSFPQMSLQALQNDNPLFIAWQLWEVGLDWQIAMTWSFKHNF